MAKHKKSQQYCKEREGQKTPLCLALWNLLDRRRFVSSGTQGATYPTSGSNITTPCPRSVRLMPPRTPSDSEFISPTYSQASKTPLSSHTPISPRLPTPHHAMSVMALLSYRQMKNQPHHTNSPMSNDPSKITTCQLGQKRCTGQRTLHFHLISVFTEASPGCSFGLVQL